VQRAQTLDRQIGRAVVDDHDEDGGHGWWGPVNAIGWLVGPT
jgi:hypothetical protein